MPVASTSQCDYDTHRGPIVKYRSCQLAEQRSTWLSIKWSVGLADVIDLISAKRPNGKESVNGSNNDMLCKSLELVGDIRKQLMAANRSQ